MPTKTSKNPTEMQLSILHSFKQTSESVATVSTNKAKWSFEIKAAISVFSTKLNTQFLSSTVTTVYEGYESSSANEFAAPAEL